MTTLDSCRIGAPAPALLMKRPHNATVHECEQPEGVCPVTELREALAREAALLRERDALIERQETLSRESDHRFLNNLQMVSSLLSMQSRAAANPETASAFALAADRVSTIGRIHRHLHSVDNVEAVAFKRFTEELSRDVMGMMSLEECAARAIIIEGDELELPTTIGIPLGFIVSELITNAVKYGQGAITVRLGRIRAKDGHFRSKIEGHRCRRDLTLPKAKASGCASFARLSRQLAVSRASAAMSMTKALGSRCCSRGRQLALPQGYRRMSVFRQRSEDQSIPRSSCAISTSARWCRR